jgi:hypothetical protein
VICRVCGGEMRGVFRHSLLRKYDVQYLQCDACGLLQTETPYWLDEAYSSAIVSADTGIMQRNIYLSKMAAAVLWRLFRGRGQFLDAAGGYGLFTRLMRDFGLDYYWSDPHAENLVARGFEGGAERGPYAAVTAFEVLEHVVDPVGFLADLMHDMGARTLLISTELFNGVAPAPAAWWYYGFDTGQHISFYRRSTLEAIARKLGLRLYSSRTIHLWTDRRLSALEFRLMTDPRLAGVLSWPARLRLRSKVWPDHHLLLKS